jgi:hypothetical protein
MVDLFSCLTYLAEVLALHCICVYILFTHNVKGECELATFLGCCDSFTLTNPIAIVLSHRWSPFTFASAHFNTALNFLTE